MDFHQNNKTSDRAAAGDASQRSGHRTIEAESLFAGAREVRLLYHNEEYRLSITRNGKLILTK